jgi:hypothetical protein
MLRGVAEPAKGDDEWFLLGMVGNYIANRGPFDAQLWVSESQRPD